MPRIFSKIANALGLVAVHVIVVRQRKGAMHIIESCFPPNNVIDVSQPITFTLVYLANQII